MDSFDAAPLAPEPPEVPEGPDPRIEAGRRAEALLEAVVAQLAACRLDFQPPPGLEDHPMAERLAAGFGNLSESIRQASQLAHVIAEGMPVVEAENQDLAERSEDQLVALGQVRGVARDLIDGLQAARGEIDGLQALGRDAGERAGEGRKAADALAEAMKEVEARTGKANDIIEVIDEVAFQTNILSINASIEAARAGEVGRGFAVVAREIRSLSERTASAARDVRGIIEATAEALQQGSASARQAGDCIGGLGGTVARTREAMEAVAVRVGSQIEEIAEVDRALARVVELGGSNRDHAREVVGRVGGVLADTRDLQDCVGLFGLPADPMAEPRHARVLALARGAADAVARRLEEAVREGAIAREALFSCDYTPIPGTRPQKHRTAFDGLCDELLPALQEPVAAAEPWIVFAICANRDGYVPTHNQRFCQPLTGDPAKDLAGNRTKRIFADRVGRTVGRHTDDHRLQVYRRDTGEIMFDLSVPVVVGGRHWGGFRIGYALG